MAMTDNDIKVADQRAAEQHARYPRVADVCFDAHIGRLIIDLDNGLGLAMPLQRLQGLEAAPPEDLEGPHISPSGFGIHFPKIDVDLYVPGLIDGYMGTARWMAAANGRAGGKISTDAKAAAARENGKLGGRPRKSKADDLITGQASPAQ